MERSELMTAIMFGGGDEWDDVDLILVGLALLLLRIMMGGF